MNTCQHHTKRIQCSSHSRWPRATGPRQPSQPLEQPSQFLTWALHTKMKQPLVSNVAFCSGNLIFGCAAGLAPSLSLLRTRFFQMQKLGHRPIARAMGSDSDSCSSQGLGDWGTHSQEARLRWMAKAKEVATCVATSQEKVSSQFLVSSRIIQRNKVIWKLTSTAANLGEASVGGGCLDFRGPAFCSFLSRRRCWGRPRGWQSLATAGSRRSVCVRWREGGRMALGSRLRGSWQGWV